MSGGRYLLLFLDERDQPGWLQLDDGRVAGRGRGADMPPPPPDDGLDEEVVAVVPATDVTLHWVDLPPLAPAQALAAARLLAVDATAEPFDRVHVAVAPNGVEGEPRAMAVASAGRMAEWLGRAAALGHDPDRIVPESLLIAAPAEGVRRIACGAVDIVRGATTAFAAEPELAAFAADGAVAEPFDADRFEGGLAAALAASPLDLRQGDFAKRRRYRVDWRHIRRLALLGAGILAATLAIQLATTIRYSFAADRLEREIDLVARHALPRAGSLANPPAQLAERLAELRGGGAGFGPTAAAAFAAVRDTPNVDLGTLAFESDGSLKLGVIAGSTGDVAALQQRLAGAGFSVSGGDVRPGGGRQLADLVVRAVSDGLSAWWRLRSVREQRLLLAMLALFAITFVWLGLVRPLGDRLAAARERHGEAVLALAAARGQADAIASLQRGPAAPRGMAVGAIVQRAAADAGFTAATVTPDGLARATVAIPAVRPQAFFGWVADLQHRYGLVVDRMSVRTNSDATLGVDLTVRSRSG